MKDSSRVLCITRNLPNIILPVKATKRVKYQCIEVSDHFICLGASTGSIYVFDRATSKLIKFISNKVCGIGIMKFSSNEKILAVTDCSGYVTCWELEPFTHNFKIIKEMYEFNGHTITALCWSDTTSRLFIGDKEGQVMSFMMGFSTSSFSLSNVESIQKSGESVIQMDFCNGKLLISTKTKTILFNEDRSKFYQIGTKPRDGLYGSCFLKNIVDAPPVIYSARPGSRLWEVDFAGHVLATHQFKEMLSIPPSPIIINNEVVLPESNTSWSHLQSFNFPLLYPMMARYLLTWSPCGIYIFEPRVGHVAAWNDQIKDIVGISCTGYYIYILHADCSVTEICLMTTNECLFALKRLGQWRKLAEIAYNRQEEILEDVEPFLAIDFHDILAKIKEDDSTSEGDLDLIMKTECFIISLEQKHAEVRAAVQEKINQMITYNDLHLNSTSDSGLDDSDDIRSNISDGSSSRISLSRMSEISLNSFWQKATNVVVSKVMTKGFTKKTLKDALQEEGVYIDFSKNTMTQSNSIIEQKEFHSAPNSPKSIHSGFKRATSEKSLNIMDGSLADISERSSPSKSSSVPFLLHVDGGKTMDNKSDISGRTGSGRKPGWKKKKRVKVINIETPANEELDNINGKGNYNPVVGNYDANKKASNSVQETSSLTESLWKCPSGNHDTSMKTFPTEPPDQNLEDCQPYNHQSCSDANNLIPVNNQIKSHHPSSDVISNQTHTNIPLQSHHSTCDVASNQIPTNIALQDHCSYSNMVSNQTAVNIPLQSRSFSDVNNLKPADIVMENVVKEIQIESTKHFEKASNTCGQSAIDDISKFHLHLPSNATSLINKLVNTTAATRNDIRDPGVLYNSKAIQDLLQRWANQLEKVSKEFQEECLRNLPQTIQDNMTASLSHGLEFECRRLLFTQLSAAFGEISNAAMLCFETNIYPKYCSILKNYEIALLNMDITLDDIYNNVRADWKVINENFSNVEEYVQPGYLPDISDGKCIVNDIEPIGKETDVQQIAINQSDFDVESPNLPCNKSLVDFISERPMEEVENKNVNELPDDQISLSRTSIFTSRSETEISCLDMIFNVVPQELNEKLFLCEQFSILEGEECQSCFVDRCRACFVLRYFPILNFTKIRSLLLWNGGCRWRTWLACMVHLIEQHRNSKISQLIEIGCISSISTELEQSDVEIFLANYARLYNIAPELVSKYTNNGRLTSWEITLLYQTGYIQNRCVDDFLQYSIDHLSDSRMDSLYIMNAMNFALTFQPNKVDIFCNCGKARPGSSTIQWEWQELLQKLIHSLLIHYRPSDKQMVLKFSQLCMKNGFWLGYIDLLIIVNEIKAIVTLVYQLGDYSLLKELINRDSLLHADDLWSYLFKKIDEDMEANDDHTCEPVDGWVPTLTLEKLLKLVARNFGSKFTLGLINKFTNHNLLSSDVYLSLIMAAELENKQENLVSRLIEVASGKVWSEKKHLFHPEFELVKNADMKDGEATPVLPSSFHSSDYIMEESDAVWGRSLNISSADCPVCTLPLCLKTMSSSTAGLIVFQCGHSFHKVCVPETACLVCFHDNFSSLY